MVGRPTTEIAKKIVVNGNTTKTTDYIAGLVYENNTLEFIPTAEGRALLKSKLFEDNTKTGYSYEYNLKDHLGNLRVACRCGDPKRDAQGAIIAGTEPLKIVQENNYDPWGMSLGTPPDLKQAVLNNRYQYNGKERVEDLGIDLYEYGFRFSDQTIGRFISVDPLSEKFPFLTTFQYASNDPIMNIDLDGLEGVQYFKAMLAKETKEGLQKGSDAQNNILGVKIGLAFEGVKGKFEIYGQGVDYDTRVANNEIALTTGGLVTVESNLIKASASTKISSINVKAEAKIGGFKIDSKEGGSIVYVDSKIEGSNKLNSAVKAKQTSKPTFEVEASIFTFDGFGTVTAGVKADIKALKTTIEGYTGAVTGFIKSIFTQGTNNTFNTDKTNRKPDQYIKEEHK